MKRSILILMDSFSVRQEAVQYAIGLAKRMDFSVVILMILSQPVSAAGAERENPGGELRARAEQAVRESVEAIKKAGLPVEIQLKIGDPASELIKFLAGPMRFQTIIWASEPDLMNKKRAGARFHWLVKIKDVVECPVVVPFMKSSEAG
jgi:hypothetical protein